MRLPAALLPICAACAVALPASAAPWVDTTLLAAAETSLALDMLQTLDIKHQPSGWLPYRDSVRYYQPTYETNPFLGEHPADVAVCTYFAGAMLLTGAVWYLLPEHFRFLAPLAVLIVEVPLIERNARAGLSIRF